MSEGSTAVSKPRLPTLVSLLAFCCLFGLPTAGAVGAPPGNDDFANAETPSRFSARNLALEEGSPPLPPPPPPPPPPSGEGPGSAGSNGEVPEQPGVTTDAYIAKADPICTRYIRIAEKFPVAMKAFQADKFSAVARFFRRENQAFSRMISELSQLTLPWKRASLIQRWLGGLRSQQPMAQHLIDVLNGMGTGPPSQSELELVVKADRDLIRANTRTQRLVRDYGFEHCDEA